MVRDSAATLQATLDTRKDSHFGLPFRTCSDYPRCYFFRRALFLLAAVFGAAFFADFLAAFFGAAFLADFFAALFGAAFFADFFAAFLGAAFFADFFAAFFGAAFFADFFAAFFGAAFVADFFAACLGAAAFFAGGGATIPGIVNCDEGGGAGVSGSGDMVPSPSSSIT